MGRKHLKSDHGHPTTQVALRNYPVCVCACVRALSSSTGNPMINIRGLLRTPIAQVVVVVVVIVIVVVVVVERAADDVFVVFSPPRELAL